MAPPRTAAVAWMRAWEPAIPAYVTAGIPDSGAKKQGFHRKEFDLNGLSRGFLSAPGRTRPLIKDNSLPHLECIFMAIKQDERRVVRIDHRVVT